MSFYFTVVLAIGADRLEMTMSKAKMNNLGVRLDDAEYARLLELAKHFGLRPTEVVRMVLKSESDAILSMKAAAR